LLGVPELGGFSREKTGGFFIPKLGWVADPFVFCHKWNIMELNYIYKWKITNHNQQTDHIFLWNIKD